MSQPARSGAPVSTPQRVVHCRSGEPFDVYVGRSTVWGNPFVVGRDGTRDEVIALYGNWLLEMRPDLVRRARQELRGKVLACWCAPLPCHADVLVDIADGGRGAR